MYTYIYVELYLCIITSAAYQAMESEKKRLLTNLNDVKLLSLLGYYIYTESSWPRIEGDAARIISRPLKPMQKSCLSFYYSMFGRTMGELNVYIRYTDDKRNFMIWSLKGNQGSSWYRADVPLSPLGTFPFQVRCSSSYMKQKYASLLRILQSICVAKRLQVRRNDQLLCLFVY